MVMICAGFRQLQEALDHRGRRLVLIAQDVGVEGKRFVMPHKQRLSA